MLTSEGREIWPAAGSERLRNMRLVVLTSSPHKTEMLADITKLLNVGIEAVTILPPKGSPAEPDYLPSEALVKEKEALLRTLVPKAEQQRSGDIWIVEDVNIGLGIAGEGYQTVRKPTGVSAEELPDFIANNFRQFGKNVVTARIEAASAWRLTAQGEPLVLVERGYLQLSPGLVEQLSDPEFVRQYLAFCRENLERERASGQNAGANNLNVPGGIRWDDLVSFVQNKGQTYGLETPDLEIFIRTWPGQTKEEALSQLVRGFTTTKVKASLHYLAKNPQLISGRLGSPNPILIYPTMKNHLEKTGGENL